MPISERDRLSPFPLIAAVIRGHMGRWPLSHDDGCQFAQWQTSAGNVTQAAAGPRRPQPAQPAPGTPHSAVLIARMRPFGKQELFQKTRAARQ